jgi:hypothetical protein
VCAALRAYLTNPEYLKLLPVRERLQKSLRDAERDTNELQAKVEANTNIIVKVRACVGAGASCGRLLLAIV